MKEDLVSIIIPVYKVEKYLKECLESIVNQTYENLEIILVNDGSPDSCGKICDEYARKDARVRVIHKENGGLSSARNAGLDIANGEYISFVDSDDAVNEKFIEILYKMCIENNCDIAECDFMRFKNEIVCSNMTQNQIDIFSNRKMQNKLFICGESIKTVVVWNKLYKKYLFKDVRFPVGKIHEDEATTYKILYYCKANIATSILQLYYYRESSNSIMGKKYNTKRLDILEAYEIRKDFYKEKNEVELYKKSLINYAETLRNCYLMVYLNVEDNRNNFLKNILQKNKKVTKEFLECREVDFVQKVKLLMFSIFPQLYVIKNKSKYMGEIKNEIISNNTSL